MSSQRCSTFARLRQMLWPVGRMVILLVTLFTCQNVWSQDENPTSERGDNPGAAAEFYLLLHQGNEGEIPENALPQAIERVRQLRSEVATRANINALELATITNRGDGVVRVGGIPVGPLAQELPPNIPLPSPGTIPDLSEAAVEDLTELLRPRVLPLSAQVNPSEWEWVGPGNIGGRTRSVLIHPSNPQIMWLGGIAGGVWRTTDAGVTWAPLYDFMASLVVSCMVIDPTDPQVLYAGTGEGFYNSDGLRGFGLFRSQDLGVTWEHLTATTGESFRWTNRIAISPDGATLLVATRSGLFRSTDDAASFQPATLEGNPLTSEVLDVRFHPTDPDRCVAGTRNGKAYLSSDGGSTWAAASGLPPITGFRGRVELCYARANPDVVYVSLDSGSGQVYRSTDGGQNYELRSSPGHLSGQGWYANTLWAGDPIDPNLLIVGGLDLHRSTDGGTTFAKISRWQSAPLSAHADQHTIIAHPGYDGEANRIIYVGNDGGIYRANDALAVTQLSGWQELNNGLGITQFYGAAGNSASLEIVGGTQDNGTLFFRPEPGTGPEDWGEIFGGDGGYSAADPQDNIFYGEYVHLRIHRSQNGNASSYIFNGIADAGNPTNALFIAPFILDPNDSNRMLAGGMRLWQSTNVKSLVPTWTPIKPEAASARISAIAVAEGNSDVVWVGHERSNTMHGSAVFKSTNSSDAMPTWSRVGESDLPRRHCTRITIDPTNHDRVYVTYGGYNADNLWATVDGGTTWNAIGAGDLPEVPNYDLEIHPTDPDILILGNEVGVFVSADRGNTWSPTNQGPTNCAVFELFRMNSTLVAATHGRGIFRISLEAGVEEPQVTAPPVKEIAP